MEDTVFFFNFQRTQKSVGQLTRSAGLVNYHVNCHVPISYPESAGFLLSGWAPGETGEFEFFFFGLAAQ